MEKLDTIQLKLHHPFPTVVCAFKNGISFPQESLIFDELWKYSTAFYSANVTVIIINRGSNQMLNDIKPFLQKPALFHPGTTALWTDEHISKGMLEAHLNPCVEAATRSHAFVDKSVAWISSMLPPDRYHILLDLGCGPGIYAERFCNKGYEVEGIDISERSIHYATRQAQKKSLPIQYRHDSYLEMNYVNQFDMATLIYCDFGVLSTDDRKLLLKKVVGGLKPQGHFIVDAFTPRKYEGKTEARTWEYFDSGFFKPTPYMSLDTFYRYDEDNTFLNQNIIVTDAGAQCFNVWEHTFTRQSLERELADAGFSHITFYDDIAGAPYTGDSDTVCAVASRN